MPDDSTALTGYCAYHKIETVVKLVANERVANENENEFREMLIRLRNGYS